jgi:protein ImuB
MSRILCLHFPLWPLQQRMVAQPELRGRAIALFARNGNRGERLTLCSPAAHAHGLRADMPVAEAKAIHGRARLPPNQAASTAHHAVSSLRDSGSAGASSSQLLLLPHDAAADRAALEQLAAWCERYSPLVGLEDAAEPTCLLLDVGGVAGLFGGEETLCEKIARQLRERGYEVQLGLADTIGAAWAVANCGLPNADCGIICSSSLSLWERAGVRVQRDQSSIADRPHPNPLPKGEGTGALSALASLPPAALRLPGDTLQLLDELGIVQIGQLLALPRETLAARLGELVVRRLQQAEGTARETIVGHRPTEDFTASWSLEHPSDKQEVVVAVLEFLLDRLSRQLDEQDLGVVQLVCRFTVVDRPAVELTLGLFRPTACAQHLLELLELQLDRRRQSGLVSDVRVEATVTAALEVQQGELFADRERDAARQLGILVDRLASRLGGEAVVSAEPQTDALPERAVRYVPLTEKRQRQWHRRLAGGRNRPEAGSTKRKSKAKKAPEAVIVSPRPLAIRDPPAALASVVAIADGPPQRFEFNRQWHAIVYTWGPERIETSWWRGRTKRRDYWRVETNTGQRFWLFRDLHDRKWFLHGQFE